MTDTTTTDTYAETETELPEFFFAAGDVVTLKSGGPLMTVSAIVDGIASCVWFCDDENAFRFEELPAVALISMDTGDVTEDDEIEDDEADA